MEAAVAAPPIRAEQGAPTLLTLLHCAVLVVREFVLRAHVFAAPLEAEDAALAVVAGQERRARYAEEGLEVEEAWGEVTFTVVQGVSELQLIAPSVHSFLRHLSSVLEVMMKGNICEVWEIQCKQDAPPLGHIFCGSNHVTY